MSGFEHDDDLLAALGRAVGPDPDVRPSDAERAELRRVVLRAAAGEPTVGADDAPVADVVPISAARRLRTRLLVGSAAVVIGLSGATAVAAAVNDGALPSPVRAVVHAVGIPVDSLDVAQAKDALKRLRTATDAELGDALARAERELADLTPTERAGLGDDVERTLAEARERLGRVEAAAAAATSTAPTTVTTAPSAAGTTPPTSPSSQPSTGTSTATSVDDRGRGDDDTSDTSTDDRGDSDDGSGGRGSDDTSGTGGTTVTSDDSGGDDDDSTVATTPGGTTDTTDDSGKGRGGGDSTAVTSSTGDTTDTTDDSGKGRGGGSDG